VQIFTFYSPGESGILNFSKTNLQKMHRMNELFVFPDITKNECLKSVLYGNEPIEGRPTRKYSRKRRFKLLDLFCCAGGAGVGYKNAGFDVVGVDIKPQPHYPLPFIQCDVLKLHPDFTSLFDAVHASPPCQSYSDLAKRNRNADAWPRLIEPVREMLVRSGLPYIIENVDGAPLHNPVVLCGTMFEGLRVLRHRLFEVNFPVLTPRHGRHPRVHTLDKRKSHYGKTNDMRDFVQVTGGGNCSIAAARDAMQIDWMTKGELNEAVPPAYTQFIGKQLFQYLVAHNQISCDNNQSDVGTSVGEAGNRVASVTT
jgi:DNA (cytosine-5)-methyltransferase 1